MEQDVVVVGAGPVGLWVAAELRLAGVGVTVLEQEQVRHRNSRALTIHPRTVEIFGSRGLADQVLAEGVPIPSGHFAVLDDRLDFAVLDTPYPYTVALLQARTEAILEAHVRAAGADVRRGHRVTGLTDTPQSVLVHLEGGTSIEAAWVVGCDGVRSTVRDAAGIAFPGDDWTCLGWLGDVELADPPAGIVSRWCLDGLVLAVPLAGGRLYRLVGINPDDVRTDWPGEFTLEELRAKVTAVFGTDFGMHSPVWLSRYSNAARQAAQYRKGRVLVAGDAAHQHMPAGGVGLNAGIQDAMNLGWKLAATVRGTAPDWLLDTYHTERHPVGQDLLRHTQAQTELMSTFSPDGAALRALMSELVAEHPEVSIALAKRLAGLSVQYAGPQGAHPLVGSRAPDLPLLDGSTLFNALHAGRFLVLDLIGGVDADATVVRASPPARPEWQGVETAVVRPDGHVGWAGPASELPQALATWGLAATAQV